MQGFDGSVPMRVESYDKLRYSDGLHVYALHFTYHQALRRDLFFPMVVVVAETSARHPLGAGLQDGARQ